MQNYIVTAEEMLRAKEVAKAFVARRKARYDIIEDSRASLIIDAPDIPGEAWLMVEISPAERPSMPADWCDLRHLRKDNVLAAQRLFRQGFLSVTAEGLRWDHRHLEPLPIAAAGQPHRMAKGELFVFYTDPLTAVTLVDPQDAPESAMMPGGNLARMEVAYMLLGIMAEAKLPPMEYHKPLICPPHPDHPWGDPALLPLPPEVPPGLPEGFLLGLLKLARAGYPDKDARRLVDAAWRFKAHDWARVWWLAMEWCSRHLREEQELFRHMYALDGLIHRAYSLANPKAVYREVSPLPLPEARAAVRQGNAEIFIPRSGSLAARVGMPEVSLPEVTPTLAEAFYRGRFALAQDVEVEVRHPSIGTVLVGFHPTAVPHRVAVRLVLSELGRGDAPLATWGVLDTDLGTVYLPHPPDAATEEMRRMVALAYHDLVVAKEVTPGRSIRLERGDAEATRPAQGERPHLRYLPRRYAPSAEPRRPLSREERAHRAKARHLVSPFIRRLPQGHRPSPEARERARFMGLILPEGATFVQAHERGGKPGDPPSGRRIPRFILRLMGR